MTLRKGITIVEVIISFTIAIILIMALYMIVYWGTDVNTINNKITKINNVMTFIQQDMLNNTPLYFELLQDSSMTYKTNINNIIQTRLEQFKLNDPIIRNIKLLNFQRERKPGIIAGNFENIYRVTIEVEWEHKGNIKKYKTDFLISSYSLKKITSGQPINDTDLSVNLPDNYYAPIMTALVTPPPPPPPPPTQTTTTQQTTTQQTTTQQTTTITQGSSGGGGGGGGCFEKGTLILTYEEGKIVPKKIEEIQPNDFILSFDNKQLLALKVEKLHEHDGIFEIIQIQTESGRIFRATSNHPAIINGKIKKFEHLQIGDTLTLFHNNTIIQEKITAKSIDEKNCKVYAIELQENKYFCFNHFIGNQDTYMLVHCGYMKQSKESILLGIVGTLGLLGTFIIKNTSPSFAVYQKM